MTTEADKEELLEEVEEELLRREKEKLAIEKLADKQSSGTMINVKTLITYVSFFIAVVGSTYGLMNFLFVSEQEFREAIHQKEIELRETTQFLKLLDRDAQYTKGSVASHSERLKAILERQIRMNEEIIKLLERNKMATTPTLFSATEILPKEATKTITYKNRLPELLQKRTDPEN